MTYIFLFEDDEASRHVFSSHFEAVGFRVHTASSLSEGIESINTNGTIYKAYFLDMKLPREAGGELDYYAGLDMRRYLLGKGVDEASIYLMSAGVSGRDETSAREYEVDPTQIVAKNTLTERRIRELLLVKLE